MPKTRSIMLSFLLLFGCTTEETLKEKGLRLLPIPNEDFFVRAEHRGLIIIYLMNVAISIL